MSTRYTLQQNDVVLVMDPGNSTGWVAAKVLKPDETYLQGGTLGMNHQEVAELFELLQPDILVVESFHLYPGMAKSLSWNAFYPCEVIGVLRYLAGKWGVPFVEQAPSVKKFAGSLGNDWKLLRQAYSVTEHTKDAYLHWKYFLRNSVSW